MIHLATHQLPAEQTLMYFSTQDGKMMLTIYTSTARGIIVPRSPGSSVRIRLNFGGGINVYSYVSDDPVGRFDPFGLTGHDEDETLEILQGAYNSATAGYFQGLLNIRNNSQGGGPYDFGHDPTGTYQSDTWTKCGVTMSAGDFGNYIAGFQAGAWDQTFYDNSWRHWDRPAEGLAYLAGIYYHASGQSDVPNDPWDNTGLPWIKRGADDGHSFSSGRGRCK
jgi:hypothetical protein